MNFINRHLPIAGFIVSLLALALATPTVVDYFWGPKLSILKCLDRSHDSVRIILTVRNTGRVLSERINIRLQVEAEAEVRTNNDGSVKITEDQFDASSSEEWITKDISADFLNAGNLFVVFVSGHSSFMTPEEYQQFGPLLYIHSIVDAEKSYGYKAIEAESMSELASYGHCLTRPSLVTQRLPRTTFMNSREESEHDNSY